MQGKRVVQVSLDIAIPSTVDGEDVARKVDQLVTYYTEYDSVGFSFVDDVTEAYKGTGII